jgi:hypothetical protein
LKGGTEGAVALFLSWSGVERLGSGDKAALPLVFLTNYEALVASFFLPLIQLGSDN